jgi:hypothetical protein
MKYKIVDQTVVVIKKPENYWIIEHPKYGCFTGFDPKWNKPRFNYRLFRTDSMVEDFKTYKAVLREFKRWTNKSLVRKCRMIYIQNASHPRNRVIHDDDALQLHLKVTQEPVVKVKAHKRSSPPLQAKGKKDGSQRSSGRTALDKSGDGKRNRRKQ